MIVDWHSHYPMHLVDSPSTLDLVLRGRRYSLRDRIQTRLLRLANRVANFPGDGDEPAVTIPSLTGGPVRVALSVLFSPFSEIDLDAPYGAAPEAGYFPDLLAQIDLVEQSLHGHEATITVARNPAELDAALARNQVALIHAIEGGFHLGATEVEVSANVATLARRGIAYITVAHLFWRRVATNAPAIPFLWDWLYRALFPQPALGLGQLGRAAVRALVSNGILVDTTHMSARALEETTRLLDEIDPQRAVPLLATHAACRFGRADYNLSDDQIRTIAARGGLIGLIACRHWMADGLPAPKTIDDTLRVLYRHIDRLHHVTGSHDHTAFGSDQDGFIKPALPGLELPSGFQAVQEGLTVRYGSDVAERICSGNGLRILRQSWRGG